MPDAVITKKRRRLVAVVLAGVLVAGCGRGGDSQEVDCDDAPTEFQEDICDGDFVEDHLKKKKTTTTKKPKKAVKQ